MAQPFNLTARLNVTGPFGHKQVIDKLRKSLGDVNVKVNVQFGQDALSRIKALNSVLAETETRLKNIQSSSAAVVNSLNSIGKVTAKTSKATSGLSKATAQTNVVLAKTAQGAAQAASEIQEFGRVSGLAVRRFAGFTVGTSVIFGFIRAVSSGISEAIKFEREMVRIGQVTRRSLQGLAPLEREIRRLATTFGASADELSIAARTISQAGFSASQAKVALEALAKSTLAPTFSDITKTTEGAIATLRQFKLEAQDLESVLGSINSVASRFAVESEDIISAIRRTGGVFAAAANPQSARDAKRSVQEFIALFTSVRANTRESAESIATGLRTIFTRIQRRSTIEFLRELNVQLEESGKFVGPFEAIRRLNAELSKLDPRDVRFSEIIEQLGGFRQVGKVIPLILRFKDAQNALNIAMSGSDSLTRDAEFAQQSLAVQIAKTREEFKKLIDEITKGGAFKTFASGLLATANAFIKLGKGLKPILPALTILGTVKAFGITRKFIRGFRKGAGVIGGAEGIGQRVGSLGAAGGNAPDQVIQQNTNAINESTKTTKTVSSTVQRKLVEAMGKNTVALEQVSKALIDLTTRLSTTAIRPKGFKTGGLIPGFGSGDKVPIMAEPGEFVLNKKAVQKAGLGRLMKFNSGGKGNEFFGANVPGFKPKLTGRALGVGNVGRKKQLLFQLIQFLEKQKSTTGLTLEEDKLLRSLKARLKSISTRRTQRFGKLGLNMGGSVLQAFSDGGRKVDDAILAKILADQASVSEFKKVLGDTQIRAVAAKYGLKSSQIRRTPAELTSPEKKQKIQSAFAELNAIAKKEAAKLKTSKAAAIDALPKFGEIGAPRLAAVFAQNISGGADPNLNPVVSDANVLSELKRFKLIGKDVKSVVMPVATSFLNKNKSKSVISGIETGIKNTTANVANLLTTSQITPDNPLIGRLMAAQGINLQDAAGKLFEAGIKAGLRLESSPNSLDFPSPAEVAKLRTIFTDIPGSVEVADAKLRNTADAYKSIRAEYARFLGNKAASKKRRAGGGRGAPNSLLTPGELVFDPKAVSEAGLSALRKFNKTGDASALGPIKSGNVFRVPGSGSLDSVPANLETDSFVVRKRSAERFALGGSPLQRFADGGQRDPLSDVAKRIRSQTNLFVANLTRSFKSAQKAGKDTSKFIEQAAKELGISVPKLVAQLKKAASGQEISGSVQSAIKGKVAADVIGGKDANLKQIVRETFSATQREGGTEQDAIRRARQAVKAERDRNLQGGGGGTNRVEITPDVQAKARKEAERKAQARAKEQERLAKQRLDVVSLEPEVQRPPTTIPFQNAPPIVPPNVPPGGPPNDPLGTLDTSARRETAARRRELATQRVLSETRKPKTRSDEEFIKGVKGITPKIRATEAFLNKFNKVLQQTTSKEKPLGDSAAALAAAQKAALAVQKAERIAKEKLRAAEENYARAVAQNGKKSQEALVAKQKLINAQRQLAKTQELEAKSGGRGLRGAFRLGGFKGVGKKIGGRLATLGENLKGAGGISALFAASGLIQSFETKTAPGAAIQAGAGGALSGGLAGFQIAGPVGAAVGAVLGGATGAISAAQQKRLEIAQEKLAKSSSRLDSAFRNLERSFTASSLKEFNSSIDSVIGAVQNMDQTFKRETETFGSIGSTFASAFDIFSLAGDRQQRKTIGAEAGSLQLLGLELAKTFGTENAVRAARRKESEILQGRQDRITREQFNNLNPAAQKAAQVFEKQLTTSLSTVDVSKLNNNQLNNFLDAQIGSFLSNSKEAVSALAALDFKKFEEIRPALELAGEGTEEYKKILLRAGTEVLRERSKEQLAAARARSVVQSNIRLLKETAEAISKIGRAAQLVTEDLDIAAGNFSDISTVLSGGLLSAGKVVNPFENVDLRSVGQIKEAFGALRDIAGGRLGGVLKGAEDKVLSNQIIQKNLTNVLRDAVNRAQQEQLRGGTLSVEQSVRQAILNDRRLGNVSLDERKRIEGLFVGGFTKRQGGGVSDFKAALETSKELSDTYVQQGKVLNESLAQTINTIIVGNQKIVQGYNQMVTTIQQANNKFDEAFNLSTQRALDIAKLRGQEVGPQEVQNRQDRIIRRLTGRAGINGGAGTTNIDIIGQSIEALQNQILADKRARDQVGVKNRAAFDALTRRISENTLRLGDAKKALETVAKSTDTLTAIQNRLAQLQQKREAGRNILEKLSRASFDPKAAGDLNRAMLDLAKLFAGQGAGTEGGAALLKELGGLFGPEVQKQLVAVIDKARLASLGGPGGAGNPAIKQLQRFLIKAGVGTPQGQSSMEQRLISAFGNISDQQVRALEIQGNIIGKSVDRVAAAIQDMTKRLMDSLRQLLQGIGGKKHGGEVRGAFKGNRDTELTKLVPGEFVVRRAVAQKFKNELALMNKGVPVERAFGIQGFKDGGRHTRVQRKQRARKNVIEFRARLLKLQQQVQNQNQPKSAEGKRELSALFGIGSRKIKYKGQLTPIHEVLREFNDKLRAQVDYANRVGNAKSQLEAFYAKSRLNFQNPQHRLRLRQKLSSLLGQNNVNIRKPDFQQFTNADNELIQTVKKILTTRVGRTVGPLRKSYDVYRRFGMGQLTDMSLGGTIQITGPFGRTLKFDKFPSIDVIRANAEREWLNSPMGRFNQGGFAGVVPGEFIVNKGVAEKNAGFLSALNQTGQIPRFQTGGIVPQIPVRTGGVNIQGGNFGQSINKFSSAINSLAGAIGGLRSFAQLATTLQQASLTLQNINIPERITMEVAPMQVNVVINGAEAFSNMQDSIRELVVDKINSTLSQHINIITGETQENFVRL